MKNDKLGKVQFIQPSIREDQQQGIDGWINGIPIAWRERAISIYEYREISIRYSVKSMFKTEVDKILDDSFLPQLYFFQFTDAILICKTEDIKKCLIKRQFVTRPNKDGSWGCYIKIKDIPRKIGAKREKES